MILGQTVVDIGVALGLPCAHVDCGFLGIIDIHEEEEITRVAVTAGVVILMDLNSIEFATLPHLHDVVVGELDVDKLVAVEAHTEILDIVGLRHSVVFDVLVLDILAVLDVLLCLLHHIPRDNHRIVVEDALNIIETLDSLPLCCNITQPPASLADT